MRIMFTDKLSKMVEFIYLFIYLVIYSHFYSQQKEVSSKLYFHITT